MIFENDLREYEVMGDDVVSLDERFLTITVDLERPTDELLELIGSRINTQRKERRITKKTAKPHGANLWDVWDKMQVSGNNLSQITRTLFKMKGNPTYDDEMRQVYERVKRAYDKAITLIEEVGRSRREPYTKEKMESDLPPIPWTPG